jgi:hypothetical protein
MKKLVLLLLFLSIPVLAQDVLTSTVPAGSQYGSAIRLYKGQVPLVIYTDSIGTVCTVSFYILTGDTTGIGVKDSSKFYPLTLISDTTVYSVALTRKKFVPLISSLFYALFSNPNYASGEIWVMPMISSTQSKATIIKMRAGIEITPIETSSFSGTIQATDTSNAWILKQIVNKSISDTSNAWIQNLIVNKSISDTSNAWILKQIVNKSISDTSNAWIQNLIKTNTTNNATTLRQDSTIAYLTSMVQLSAAKYSKTFHDTLSTRIDTVSRRIAGDTTNNLNYIFVNSKAWEADITVNDTVEISSDANFGTGNVTIVYPNTQPGLPIFKRLLFYFPNLYIRRYVTTGGTGTVTIDLRIWAY